MPVPYQSRSLPTSFATCSIGWSESHTLPEKLSAIAAAGFDGIELSMPDILSYGAQARSDDGTPPLAADDYDALVAVGGEIRELVRAQGLRILMLQPFANFEGWDPEAAAQAERREDAFARARGWLRVMDAVGTDMLQVGSSDAAGIAGAPRGRLVDDLRALADLCAARGFRVCYENWCWATLAPGWRDVWDIVRRVDRPNVGLCLDTFQSAGGEWGDPTTRSGLVEDGRARDEVERGWRESLRELAETVPADKIYLLQISDAYRMDPPLEAKEDDSGLRPRGQWSHDYRPLPYDGGYLPIEDFLKAVLDTGFDGWLSMEVFDGKAGEKYKDMDSYAKRGIEAIQKMLKS